MNEFSLTLLCTSLGFGVGALLAWGVQQTRLKNARAQGRSERALELGVLSERAGRIPELEARLDQAEQSLSGLRRLVAEAGSATSRLSAELKAERDSVVRLIASEQAERESRSQAETRIAALTARNAELATLLESERLQTQEKLVLLQNARDELAQQFKLLANEIFEDKARRFNEQSQTQLGQLLDPLKQRLNEFKAKVEEIHTQDTEQQALLRSELGHLKELNRQITEEAHGLATALKGEAKKQGNWGELVLDNVLERSGLEEGRDYRREVSFNTEDGRKRPDVVLSLPQGKHLVIDAKVSLNAYTRFVNADTEQERHQALCEHVKAISSRITELSERNYFALPGLNSPEMVFMFIPIESAFVEALKADQTLFQNAIERNVLVATPTTLLTSLNIVRQLWRFETQNAHTYELAARAGKVHKKLVSFLESMEGIGAQLERTRECYLKALGQLCNGKGNLISQAQEFERMGIAVQGSLPERLVAQANLALEQPPSAQLLAHITAD